MASLETSAGNHGREAFSVVGPTTVPGRFPLYFRASSKLTAPPYYRAVEQSAVGQVLQQRSHPAVHFRQLSTHGLEVLLVCIPSLVVDSDVWYTVFDEATWPVSHGRIPPGGTMFLYTDGLIEARHGSLTFGAERCCEVLERERRSALETRLERLVDAARRHEDESLRDDVVVLAVERPAVIRW